MKKTSKLSAIFYKVRFKYKLLFCFFLFYIGLLLLVLLLFNHYTIKAKEIELKKQIDLSHSALKFHFEDMKESRYNFIQSYSKHLDLLKSNYFLRKESIVKMSRHLLENYELNDKFKTFHSINELNAIQTLHYSPFIDQMTPNDISSQYIIPMDSSNEGHLTLLMGSVKKNKRDFILTASKVTIPKQYQETFSTDIKYSLFVLQKNNKEYKINFLPQSSNFTGLNQDDNSLINTIINSIKKKNYEGLITLNHSSYFYKIFLTLPESSIYAIHVLPYSNFLFDSTEKSIFIILTLLSTSFLLILIALYLFKITVPFDILRFLSRKSKRGNFQQTFFIESNDEIGDFTKTYNALINQLKRSRADLANEQLLLKNIINNINEVAIVVDKHNRLLIANKKAELLFQFSSKDLKGKFIENYTENRDLINILSTKLNQSIQKNLYHFTVSNNKGTKKTFELQYHQISNKKGIHIGGIIFLKDISKYKALDDLRESFLKTISHEFKTPLTSIIGYLEMAINSTKNHSKVDKEKFLQIVLNESIILRNLIDDMIDMSSFKAGKIRLELCSFSINKLFKSLLKIFTPIANQKSINITCDLLEKEFIIYADKQKVQRILTNFLSNAFKFTTKGQVTLKFQSYADKYLFSVSDTGIGILEEDLYHIFDKFFKIDYDENKQYEGIGAGLSIAKQLTEIHKGQMWVESQYQKGSTFYFSISKSTPSLNKNKNKEVILID